MKLIPRMMASRLVCRFFNSPAKFCFDIFIYQQYATSPAFEDSSLSVSFSFPPVHIIKFFDPDVHDFRAACVGRSIIKRLSKRRSRRFQ